MCKCADMRPDSYRECKYVGLQVNKYQLNVVFMITFTYCLPHICTSNKKSPLALQDGFKYDIRLFPIIIYRQLHP